MDRFLRRRMLLPLFFLSGATSLIYEVVWTRLLILSFGSTVLALSTIVTVFLGGLALGGFLFADKADRVARPLRLYGAFELAIGAYALILPPLVDSGGPLREVLRLGSDAGYEIHALVRFAVVGSLLIAPTLLMGATLPMLAAFVVRAEGEDAAPRIGLLYGINTLGAVAGVAGSGFLLLPSYGMFRTQLASAVGNFIVAALAFTVDRFSGGAVKKPERAHAEPQRNLRLGKLIFASAFASGLAALILEICWSRLLGVIFGSSIHGFSVTLASYLVGIAMGSVLAALALRRRAVSLRGYAAIQLAIATGAALTFPLVREVLYWSFRLQADYRDSPVGWLLARYLLSSIMLLPPTLMMGAAFPIALALCGVDERAGRASGRLYGWNTAGGILGAFLAGFVLLPVLGLERTMLAAIGILASLAVALHLVSARGTGTSRGPFLRYVLPSLLAFPLAALLLLRPAWNPALLSLGGVYFRTFREKPKDREAFFRDADRRLLERKPLYYRDGRNASVGVYDGGRGYIFLEVNGKVDASNSRVDMPTQALSGVIPLLTRWNPKRALVIGAGSGTTLGMLTLDRSLEKIDLVELEPSVIEAMSFFEKENHRPLSDPRVRWIENDGRNYLATTTQDYDVIISEPSNPWMMGAANLFTKDFFEIARSRLTNQGVFAQWLQLYAIELEDLRILLRTVQTVFPDVIVFQLAPSDLLVVAFKQGPHQIDVAKLVTVFQEPERGEVLRSLTIAGSRPPATPGRVLSLLRLGSAATRAFAGEGVINTDDNMRIETSVPFSMLRATTQRNSAALLEQRAPLLPLLLLDNAATSTVVLADLVRELRAQRRTTAAQEIEGALR